MKETVKLMEALIKCSNTLMTLRCKTIKGYDKDVNELLQKAMIKLNASNLKRIKNAENFSNIAG